MSMTFIKVVKIRLSKKFTFPWNQLDAPVFFLFHLYNPKPNQNHQISISRAKIRSTQSQICVRYRDYNICIKRNTHVNTGDLKILHKKMSKQGWFSRHYLFSKIDVVCLQPYAWLESYDFYGSFSIMIWGSLIVSSVLWLLSWRNTLSVTHSDTASYIQ